MIGNYFATGLLLGLSTVVIINKYLFTLSADIEFLIAFIPTIILGGYGLLKGKAECQRIIKKQKAHNLKGGKKNE